MSTDYLSAARALALPTSPLEPTSPSLTSSRPAWSRSGSARRSSSIPFSTREAATLRDQVINYAKAIWRRVSEAWGKMSFWQRAGVVVILLVALTLGVGLMIMTGRLFLWLGPMAEKWEESKVAVVVLWFAIVLVSFPPLVGWTTLATICGFIFGLWKGWLLAATATVVGSTCSFIVSRSVLSNMVNRLMEKDKRFAALALTLKYDGLKLLCMIRLCPLPYSICNGAVSTFPTVQPLMYGLATAIITPKLLVPSFIGNRLRILAEKNEEMSAGSKAVNVISIVVSIAIGIFTGLYIYRRTIARAKELEAKERADIRRSLQADHAARRPHRAFSEDPDTNAAATSLARDEEERIGFGFEDGDDDDDDEDQADLGLVEDENGSESDSDRPSGRKKPYRDDFTDDESDVFKDGDGSDNDTIGLHSHRRGSRAN